MKKVLIVDDSLFMRRILKNILEKNGFAVVGEAEDAKSGIEQYILLRPDIITLDMVLPGMDGLAALKEIKKIDNDAVVIMVTAMGHENYMWEAVEYGAKGYIVKPFDSEQVVKALNQTL